MVGLTLGWIHKFLTMAPLTCMFLPIPIKWQRKTCSRRRLCNLSKAELNTTTDSHVTSPQTNEFPLSAGKFDRTKQNHMTRALELLVCVRVDFVVTVADRAHWTAGLMTQALSIGRWDGVKRHVAAGAQVLVCLIHMCCNQFSFGQNTWCAV